MEDGWKFPLGYTSKLNFPHGTPIAYTDSIPFIAAAGKLFSTHLPSTFQYLGLVFVFPTAIAIGYGDAVWPFLVAGLAVSGFGVGLDRLRKTQHKAASPTSRS